jgi:murein DD-endopeptidase MepM/ murein hydrolase activator NlpD
MRALTVRRVTALMVAGCVAVAGLVAAANAESSVEVALREKRDLLDRIVVLHETRRVRRIALHQRIRNTKARLRHAPGAAEVGDPTRYRHFRERQLDRLAELRAEERRLIKAIRARVRDLRAKRSDLAEWIESLPLQRCPVAGSVDISDNFGIWHDHGKDGSHTHQGVDMGAATGTPIVAPFDGDAVANPSDEGGMAVEVYGAGGYSYNAHLSAYGKLGAVRAGDVIGYVGSTGNASGPHLHFEWHPADGAAVDPFLYLAAVC